MKTNEIREKFLSFFEKKGHKLYSSAPLVPEDKSILFTVAGMVPFKKFFLGYSLPQNSRATSAQRCIRTNDIDSIGKTARHLTTFEMLGNFSFGDYFKKEAIKYGWELVTKDLGIPGEKLIVTIFKDDNDAYDIWKEIVPESRIKRLDRDNNFWEMGAEGPCGPCSEIYYAFDSTDNFDPDSTRFIEIYNMVFMEFNKQDGKYTELPKKNIDTGMGLERVAFVLQNVESVFETDLIKPIKNHLQSLAKVRNNVAENIVVDHLKSACFLISEGVRPSHEKQGYVLRRLIRRAARYGYEIGLTKFMDSIVDVVAASYPFLKENILKVKDVINREEIKFADVLVNGLEFANDYIKRSDKRELDPDVVFKLYDTYGFPFELTKEIAEKQGKIADENKFKERFEKHQDISRNSAKFDTNVSAENRIDTIFRNSGATKFVGYEKLNASAELLDVYDNNELLEMIFDNTPFYAESGGQIGDKGVVYSKDFKGLVVDVNKKMNVFVHYVRPINGIPTKGKYQLEVDSEFRNKVKANHTATHLLHSAAKQVLGNDIKQAGSLVTDERLRLDLNMDRALTLDELMRIESIVNAQILRNASLVVNYKNIEDAKKEGAIAYFEDRYGDIVRVVNIPDFSIELCGGTHVTSTGEIGLFKIISEKSMSANTRRIEAVTRLEILKLLYESQNIVESVAEKLKVQKSGLIDKVDKVLFELNSVKSNINKFEVMLYEDKLKNALDKKSLVNKVNLIEFTVDENLVQYVAKIKLSNYLLMVTTSENSLVLVSDIKSLHLGDILKNILSKMGLKGGGKPDFARTKLDNANSLVKVIEQIKQEISNL